MRRNNMEDPEIYDPLANKSTLVIYMIQSGDKWVEINSDELAIGNQMVRNLRLSYDHRPIHKRGVKIGERLTYHVRQEGSPWNTYKVVPSEWAIARVTHYEPSDLEELPEFRGITIAYCVRQPLSPEEVDAMSYEIVSKVSVDSFGGDEEAYQKFLTSEQSKGYVRG